MKKITLFTSNNCPQCVEAKKALDAEGLEYEAINAGTPEGAAKMLECMAAIGPDTSAPRGAPAMYVEGCKASWCGADCLNAIEGREWED